THLNLDAFSTLAHGVLHGALHGTTEHNPTLQLLSNTLRYQSRIQIRLANLFNVDMHGHAHLLADFSAQLINIFTCFTDHNAWTGSVDGDASSVSRTLNINAAH